MPELPEVETIARRLREVLPGKQLSSIEVRAAKSFAGDSQLLMESPIETVQRRAKILSLKFANGYYLATHLKMTGQLIYVSDGVRLGGGHPTADWVRDLPSSHTRVHYSFTDGSQLFFNDQRLFGWMRVLGVDEHQNLFANLGPDIIDDAVTVEYLEPIFARRKMPIKQVIMDNQVVCGIGNIYACDALNLARISPFRPANSLTREEISRLLEAAKTVITKGIELGGTTTDGKYVDINGFAGGYQAIMLTYDREGQPCYNCGAPIQKKKLGGRGTYYCAHCQR